MHGVPGALKLWHAAVVTWSLHRTELSLWHAEMRVLVVRITEFLTSDSALWSHQVDCVKAPYLKAVFY